MFGNSWTVHKLNSLHDHLIGTRNCDINVYYYSKMDQMLSFIIIFRYYFVLKINTI